MKLKPLLALLVPVTNRRVHGVPHFGVVVEGSVWWVETQVGGGGEDDVVWGRVSGE